jgi:hypothetical protein
MITMTRAITSAEPPMYGTSFRIGPRCLAIAAPPKAPAEVPTTVMPICTVARNVSGSLRSRKSALAPPLAWLTSSSMRDLRSETTAISEPARAPLISINTKMNSRSERMSQPPRIAPDSTPVAGEAYYGARVLRLSTA